jgi:CIC family chloride channel protein
VSSAVKLLRLLIAALVIGGLTGLVGACFRLALARAEDWREQLVTWSHRQPGWGLLVPVAVAALATALARYLVRRLAPDAGGSGIPRVEAVVRLGSEPDPPVLLPVKFLGGLLAIGSGLALGREGPTVQIGATLASTLSGRFGLRDEEERVLVAGGAAAGLATAFGAPFGGAVFILEEVLQRFEGRTSIVTLGATGAAIAVADLLLGSGPEFRVNVVQQRPGIGLLMYLGFGLALGMVGALYNRLVLLCLDQADRLPRVPVELKAAVIGAGAGLLAYAAPGVSGGGDTQLQQLLLSLPTIGGLLLLIGARLIFGPISYAAGVPGGLFAPILLVGGALGALAGILLHGVVPWMVPDAESVVVVGTTAFFTATIRAPLTGIALVTEMTGVNGLLMPMLAAACGAFVAARLLGSKPIYDSLRERAEKK